MELEFDPGGEASERWLDFAYRFPDAGRDYELMVRAEIAMLRGDVERAEKIGLYFTARGWDLEYGWPRDNKMEELGLEKDIPALQKYRTSAAE